MLALVILLLLIIILIVKLVQQQKRQPLVRLRNIQTSRLITFFSQLPLRHCVQIPNNASGGVFLSKLGRNSQLRKLADQSGDDREISLLFQRLSVLIQRYNAVLLHDCFVKEEEEE